MRIALVCPYAWERPGGVQTHVRALAGVLRTRGHEVVVVAPRAGAPTGPSNDEGVVTVGRAIGIPANGSIAPITFGPGAALGLSRVLRRFSPEVMHLHEPLIPSLCLQALVRPPCPVAGTFHASAERSLGYAAARPILQRAAARLAVRTAVSDAARKLAVRYFPGDYVLTPNGVEVDRFATAEALEFDARPVVLFLGRIERRKGLEVLIQAMTRIRDLGVRLVVAGTGPHEPRYRSLARALRVEVDWRGSIAADDVPRIYAAADVYCAPGIGGESFGIVLIEAMAAGTPVVCSDLEAFRSVAGGAAEFVPRGRAGPLADALRRVLGDRARREEMTRQGRRLAAMYDWNRLVAGVEAVYERAVGAW